MSAFALPIVLARAPVAVGPGPNNTTTTTTTTTTEAPGKLDDIIIENDVTTTVVSSKCVKVKVSSDESSIFKSIETRTDGMLVTESKEQRENELTV